MTSLMKWVRRDDVRRATAVTVSAALVFAFVGCDRDRTSNADGRKPIAVTASGIEIVEVMRNESQRTVEAVVVAGGEEKEVTIAPVLDGPLSSGAKLSLSRDGKEILSLSFGMDSRTGVLWLRQQAGDDVFELMRVVANGRAHEEYFCNGEWLDIDYVDQDPVVIDKVVARYLRGESTASYTADVQAIADQLPALQAFVAKMPPALTETSADGRLLLTLLKDRTFVETTLGREFAPDSAIGAVCSALSQCAFLICRLAGGSVVCGLCVAGTMACIALDWICSFIGCNCCFD